MAYSRQELVELGWSFDDACDYYLDYINDMYVVVDVLVDERNKLRELVRELVRWHGAEHQPHEELQFWGDKNSGVYARMRELGIEVE